MYAGIPHGLNKSEKVTYGTSTSAFESFKLSLLVFNHNVFTHACSNVFYGKDRTGVDIQ